MIESVLVANRGEIAVRVIRTCRRLGIRTIAVYSDVDARTRHVADADRAVRIESYLNQTGILEAARQTHARAIHPGYGFLAENAEFAQAVMDAGLTWIGPPPRGMRALGDKAHAKVLAEQTGVPLLPGYHGDDQLPESLRERADEVGYPVLIKASAGGGGRGMRVVESPEKFLEALEGAKREAMASFGDDRVLLERYLARPRHVEVQVMGDQHGNLIHLGERECSIQRRHQKLIEESPSPAVDDDLRRHMGQAALRLARAAGYTNAGTVEFLLDEAGRFAFLEVNARLQVEHPVTEMVTGLDLVELQLRVASGEHLRLTQADVRLEGHAIEARVIAEDALAGFLPSSGTVRAFEFPPVTRVDAWVAEGTVVSPYYDSLLAKVIAHGRTRNDAARDLANALKQARIDGVRDNIDLLLDVVESPAFRRGELHTRFLEDHHLLEELAEVPSEVLAAASAFDTLHPRQGDDPWTSLTAWRVGRFDQPANWARAGRGHSATVSAEPGTHAVVVDVGDRTSRVVPLSADRVSVDGEAVTVWDHDDRRIVEWAGRAYRLQRAKPLSVEETARERGAGGAAGNLVAPMPGRVVKIAVERGQPVAQNQPLVVLEAMKMEHVVEATHAGIVSDLCVEVGQQVAAGERLVVIGPAEGASPVE